MSASKKSKSSKSVVARPPPALYTPHPSQITEPKVSSKSKKSVNIVSKSTPGEVSATKASKPAEIKSKKQPTSHADLERTSSGSQSSVASNASGVTFHFAFCSCTD